MRLSTSCTWPLPLTPGPSAERQLLHDEPEAGVLRRALGLAQDARRGGVPGAGHGAGRGLELVAPGPRGQGLPVSPRRARAWRERARAAARRLAAGSRWRPSASNSSGSRPCTAWAKPAIARRCSAERRGAPIRAARPAQRRGAEAEVQDRARAAPGALARGSSAARAAAGREGSGSSGIGPPSASAAHAVEGERDARAAPAGRARSAARACRPPAVGRCRAPPRRHRAR